jgi:hypothetical protein
MLPRHRLFQHWVDQEPKKTLLLFRVAPPSQHSTNSDGPKPNPTRRNYITATHSPIAAKAIGKGGGDPMTSPEA